MCLWKDALRGAQEGQNLPLSAGFPLFAVSYAVYTMRGVPVRGTPTEARALRRACCVATMRGWRCVSYILRS